MTRENEPDYFETRREREPHWRVIEREKLIRVQEYFLPLPKIEMTPDAVKVLANERERCRS